MRLAVSVRVCVDIDVENADFHTHLDEAARTACVFQTIEGRQCGSHRKLYAACAPCLLAQARIRIRPCSSCGSSLLSALYRGLTSGHRTVPEQLEFTLMHDARLHMIHQGNCDQSLAPQVVASIHDGKFINAICQACWYSPVEVARLVRSGAHCDLFLAPH